MVLGTLKASPSLNNGNKICLENAKTPLSAIFPGSQNAFFNFFFIVAALSNKSILESSSDEDIFAPAKPGTGKKINVEEIYENYNIFGRQHVKASVHFSCLILTHWIH